MNWLTTFTVIIRSNINGLLENFENPERVLNQLIIDMEEELQRVRANVAGVIADEIQLGRQVDKARAEAEQWQQRAIGALERKDEASAKAALEQKVRAAQQAETLEREYLKHKDETAKLHRAIRDLESKIRQAGHKRTLLVARLARVESARTVNTVLKGIDGSSALAQFHRLEQRVERAEALEEAHARLDDRDPKVVDLEQQFTDQEHRDRLQKELEELKRRVENKD